MKRNKNKAKGVQKTRRIRRIVTTEPVQAFYVNADGSLSLKGEIKANRILKVSLIDIISQDGLKYYRVLNVKHKDVYVPLSKKNAHALCESDIVALLEKVIASEGIKVLDHNNPEHKEAIDGVMTHVLTETEGPQSSADGLDYYTEKAFLSDDGFLSDCGCSGDDGTGNSRETPMEKYFVALKRFNSKWEQKIKEAKKKHEDVNGQTKRDLLNDDGIVYSELIGYDNHPPMCADDAFFNSSGNFFRNLFRKLDPRNVVKELDPRNVINRLKRKRNIPAPAPKVISAYDALSGSEKKIYDAEIKRLAEAKGHDHKPSIRELNEMGNEAMKTIMGMRKGSKMSQYSHTGAVLNGGPQGTGLHGLNSDSGIFYLMGGLRGRK